MRFNTRAIHEGQPNDPQTGAVTFPIFQTSTFGQQEPAVHKGFVYGRTDNPTRTALEKNLASLEEAKFGLAFSSGLGAVNTVLNLLQSGDHVVACQDLYGGTYRIFTKVYQKFGLQFTMLDTTRVSNIESALKPNTKVIWLESPSNPLLRITDIKATTEIAKKRGILTVVDNTFATPYLQQPLKLGADIVLHSTTKYLNGHADVIGGALITNSSDLNEKLKFYQNSVGAVPGPQDCFLILRGTKTLSLRMDRHCFNARKLAEFLSKHKKIEKVHYPGLEQHPGYEIAKRQMRDFGGMVSFEIKANEAATRKFSSSMKIITLAESLGAIKSLLCHPASMTHASVEPEVRRKGGISDSLVRMSVGLEDWEDLVEDLEQALAKIQVNL